MTIVIFAQSFPIYEIFANQLKHQKFDIENKDQRGEKLPLMSENAKVQHEKRIIESQDEKK